MGHDPEVENCFTKVLLSLQVLQVFSLRLKTFLVFHKSMKPSPCLPGA